MNFVVIDFETLGVRPGVVAVDMAAVVFDLNGEDRFVDLVNDTSRTFYVKFDLDHQVKAGRKVDPGTLRWWQDQPREVQHAIMPSDLDVTVNDGLHQFDRWLKEHGCKPKDWHFMSRGESFDFPLMDSLVDQFAPELSSGTYFPCAYWRQDDIRTALRYMLMQPDLNKFPVPKDALEGFIKHDSIHDVCKDVILLQHARKYALGMMEVGDDFVWV